ncbi:serine protease inhibitor dipetalogastin-like [Cydia fagiglandana]|uniref:serine protease inhibitor dipetalogastin-like n=1 Tax=Cydia fagiglandana TaxID=1458189 RepID=UPI002FEE45FD
METGWGILVFSATTILWLAPGQGMPNRRSLEESEDDCESAHDTLLCGSNDVTYLNLCEFQKALDKDPTIKIIENGACFCDPKEGHEWDPLCASNGQSYANNCELEKARKTEHLSIRHLGLCNAMLKRDTITYRELQKVKLWSSFMPKKLFASLSSRDLADGPRDIKAKDKKKRDKGKETLGFGRRPKSPRKKNRG